MSKKLTRLPGDEPPPDAARGARILALRPRRTLDTWTRRESDGNVVITHPKPFGKVERGLAKALRGSLVVNRPLDEYGSEIWVLCDGRHSVEQIARSLEARFKERFEPAVPRTLKFLELLAKHGLVVVGDGPSAEAAAP
jgi:hypothetical protein